jgi:hypothetical protein
MAVNALGPVVFGMCLVVEYDGRFPVAGLGKNDRIIDGIKRAAYKA